VQYSAYGVPFGIPAGNASSNGANNVEDLSTLINWINNAVWDARWDLNADGSVTTADYACYPERTLGRGKLSWVNNRIGYAGYQHAPELAGTKYLLRHRWLLADLAIFNRRDPHPTPFVDGMNLYQYAKSRPLVGVDPTGLYFWVPPFWWFPPFTPPWEQVEPSPPELFPEEWQRDILRRIKEVEPLGPWPEPREPFRRYEFFPLDRHPDDPITPIEILRFRFSSGLLYGPGHVGTASFFWVPPFWWFPPFTPPWEQVEPSPPELFPEEWRRDFLRRIRDEEPIEIPSPERRRGPVVVIRSTPDGGVIVEVVLPTP
jgi:RHS repeat-associated protein